MKRNLLWIAVSALVIFVCIGCAQTDYPCITDEAQANASNNNNDGDNGGPGGHPTGFINTNGKAHIAEVIQFGVILADGTTVEIINFLDQKTSPIVQSDLYNYEHRHATADFEFHDDQYCNPDWTGCSAVTNTENIFCGADGKGGLTIASGPCSDGLVLLFGDSVRDNECGRAGVNDAQPNWGGLTILDAISMISDNSSLVEYRGETWHEMTLHPQLTFDYENGSTYGLALPAAGIPAKLTIGAGFQVRVLVDFSAPEFSGVLHDLQAIADANPGERFAITAELFGRTLDLGGSFRLVDSELAPGFYTDKASRLFGG